MKSLGLEDTRVHLEALCDMRKPVKEANEAVLEVPNGKGAEVISLQGHLEKRSRAV